MPDSSQLRPAPLGLAITVIFSLQSFWSVRGPALFAGAGLLQASSPRCSLLCVCVCEISQYLERRVRLTELHALLPLEQYKMVINHNWNRAALSVWPEVKREVTAAALLSRPPPPGGSWVINHSSAFPPLNPNCWDLGKTKISTAFQKS